MFRKKGRLAALVAGFVLLTGCAAQTTGQAKLLQEEVKTTSANLKTVQAFTGSLQREFSMNAEVVYPEREVVRLQADEAQDVEHLVNQGQEVKAGDVIAVFRKQTDDIRLTAIELELEQLETQRQDGLDDRAEQMEELIEQIEDLTPPLGEANSVRDNLKLENLQMQLEKMQIEQQRFEKQLDEQVRQLKQERKQLKDAQAELNVTAPVDGEIESIQYMVPGSMCTRGQPVVIIHNPDRIILKADKGTMGEFRVGQKVRISYGKRNDRSETTGCVVAADNLLDEAQKTEFAYIELDEEIDPGLLMGVQVYAMNMYIEDVLLLPRNAVQYDGGKAYVEVVSGAGTSVRYVITGPNDGENIMILAGLEEGTAVLEK